MFPHYESVGESNIYCFITNNRNKEPWIIIPTFLSVISILVPIILADNNWLFALTSNNLIVTIHSINYSRYSDTQMILVYPVDIQTVFTVYTVIGQYSSNWIIFGRHSIIIRKIPDYSNVIRTILYLEDTRLFGWYSIIRMVFGYLFDECLEVRLVLLDVLDVTPHVLGVKDLRFWAHGANQRQFLNKTKKFEEKQSHTLEKLRWSSTWIHHRLYRRLYTY